MEVHVIVCVPKRCLDFDEPVDPDDFFDSVSVLGPFVSRADACSYADRELDGQGWRVDTVSMKGR